MNAFGHCQGGNKFSDNTVSLIVNKGGFCTSMSRLFVLLI